MFGCHNCGVDVKKYKTYEESPCSKCEAAKDPFPHSTENSYDMSLLLPQEHPAYQEEENELESERDKIFQACARSVLKLLELQKNYPVTAQIVIEKMKNPLLSLNELANKFSCKKQNIHYHLGLAKHVIPELVEALFTDTRFNRKKASKWEYRN